MATTIEGHRNWAGNLAFGATVLHRPETVEQVQELVAASARIKAVGARHCINGIADTPGEHISLERLDRVVALDRERRTVTIEGGMRYVELGAYLHAEGFALHNTASLPQITVAGAVATATHGSGDRNGNLATSVAALDLVTASGEIISLSRERDGDRFRGAVVGLGALGVIVRLTLDIVPTFEVRQVIYRDLPLTRLDADFAAIMGGAYSVSLFTDWHGDTVNQVWAKRRVADEAAPAPSDYFGAAAMAYKVRPSGRVPADVCTDQLDLPGPWHLRLPHFNPDGIPSSGSELQTEYFVPREHAQAAFRAIDGLRNRLAPLMGISEVRSIAADDLHLSMCYERDSIAFHFTWLPDWPAVRALLPLIEERLAPFDARPHWGKLFTMSPERVRSLYPRLPEFRALAREYDPTGKFHNALLDEYIFVGQRAQ